MSVVRWRCWSCYKAAALNAQRGAVSCYYNTLIRSHAVLFAVLASSSETRYRLSFAQIGQYLQKAWSSRFCYWPESTARDAKGFSPTPCAVETRNTAFNRGMRSSQGKYHPQHQFYLHHPVQCPCFFNFLFIYYSIIHTSGPVN